MITLYRANGEQKSIQGPLTLKQAQSYVGGYVELITLGPKLQMIVNENGLTMKLDFNVLASGMALDYIVGDVLVLSDSDIWK